MEFFDTFAGVPCGTCKTFFNIFGPWAHTCDACGKSFCSTCRVKVDLYEWLPRGEDYKSYKELCKPCWDKLYGKYDVKYKSAMVGCKAIEVYPRTYKGHIPILNEGIPIVSGEFRDIDSARYQLRFIAHVMGYDVVYEAWMDRSIHKSGNYVYSTWVGKGKAGKLK